MLRLLRLRKFPLFNSQVVSYPLNGNIYTRTCSLCNHRFTPQSQNDLQLLGSTVSTRLQSTNIRTAVKNSLVKRKKRRSKKKYAELLEVTGSSTNERKAAVSTLKAKHLSLLANQPDINLSQLHNLKKVTPIPKPKSRKKLNNLAGSVIVNNNVLQSMCEAGELNVNEQVLLDELDEFTSEKNTLLKDSELLYSLNLPVDVQLKKELLEDLGSSAEDHCVPNVLKDEMQEQYGIEEGSVNTMRAVLPSSAINIIPKSNNPQKKSSFKKHQMDQMAKVKRQDLERAGKEESLVRSLISYLDLCISCNLHNRGLITLLFYRNNSKKDKNAPPARDIKLYNIMLNGFAGKGNIDRVKEILHVLHEDKIPLTIQSYAACFECIGRLPNNSSNTSILNEFYDDLKKQGFNLNDIMTKSVFISDQREVILHAIRRLEHTFEPVIPEIDTCYSCSLLQELNAAEGKSYKSPAPDLLTPLQLKELAYQQLKFEKGNYVKVRTIEKRSEPTETIQYYRKKLQETQEGWSKTISDAFERDLEAVQAQHKNFKSCRSMSLYPYLRVLEPDQYKDIILQEIRKLAEGSETFSPTVTQLYRGVGSLVLSRYQVKYKQTTGILDKVHRIYEDYCDWYLNPQNSQCKTTRECWQRLVHTNQEGPSVNIDEKLWSNTVLSGVGKFLYNIILRDIKIDLNITKTNSKTQHLLPAFYSVFRNQGRFLKEEIKPHPILARLFRGAAQEELVFEVTNVPMVCPPVPWSSATSGGYLVVKAGLIRLPQQAIQQRRRLDEAPVQQLYAAFDSLNQLGAVPWIVNKPVLDIVIEVFNSGGSQKLDIPEPPSACPHPGTITLQMTKLERFHVYQKRMALRRRKAEMYSLWCDALYRLSLANHFRDKIFWLPHNMDFRGRVYPCPPHLNHLGADMARAILYFAKGEPLGPHGLDWLKIHLVNLTGLKKKESIYDRLQYAEKIMPDVIDSAENPLSGRMWWAQSETPWQSLACCLEIAQALKSNDPENYICHFPVHQDGSCNGLQHYAALGRDKAGAESVNLTPADKPQDVYSCIATLVEKERFKDAADGLKIAQILDGFIQRRVIKQTVMTTVYGVTRFGARLQIARQLKDIEDFPKDYVWSASTYLVGKTFECLREMFTSTKEIQDWFTECARTISQVCGQNVEWVTPLGLPIVQPYNRISRNYDMVSKWKIQEHYSMDMFERPNVMKQKNAFPPNFIHSLDSSHMMLTSLFCERSGITFVSVHDCYWTHPNTVDIMNKVCREQFVALHSEPILEDLSEFLQERYSYSDSDLSRDGSVTDMAKLRLNNMLMRLPTTGNFDLNSVLKSVYFFS